MTTMPALPLPISAQPPAAEAGMAVGRRGADDSGEAGVFPQMLASQRQAVQAAGHGHGPRARGAEARQAETDARAPHPDDAALQLIATLLPGAQVPAVETPLDVQTDGKAAPDAEPRLAGPRLAPAPAGDAMQPGLADALQAAPRTGTQASAGGAEALAATASRLPAASFAPPPSPQARPAPSGREGAPAIASRPASLPPPSGNTAEAVSARGMAQPATGASTDAASTSAQPLPTGSADLVAGSLAAGTPAPAAVPAAASSALASPAAQPGAALLISAPLGHPGWGQAMAQQVGHALQAASQGVQQAELRLDPPDLGPLRVTLQIQDNVAHAWFVSPHASVRQAVESALPHLAQQLADAGLSLGDAHVGSEQADHQPPPRAAASPASGSAPGGPLDEGAIANGARPQAAASGSHLLIDTYA